MSGYGNQIEGCKADCQTMASTDDQRPTGKNRCPGTNHAHVDLTRIKIDAVVTQNLGAG